MSSMDSTNAPAQPFIALTPDEAAALQARLAAALRERDDARRAISDALRLYREGRARLAWDELRAYAAPLEQRRGE